MNIRSCASLLALAFTFTPALSHAAESYDNCAGTINSLPAVIGTQGVWCMTKDLTSSTSTGAAITVSANNVTIACNDFKLGGLGAGPATEAIGILADGRSNLIVRGCNIRGFRIGVHAGPNLGYGHLIENNRFDGNTRYAVWVVGDGSVIRDNLVNDTGGGDHPGNATVALLSSGANDILDNMVNGVTGEPGVPDYAIGIFHYNGQSGVIAGNRISNVVPDPTGSSNGILAYSPNLVIRDNIVTNATTATSIYCLGAGGVAYGNTRAGAGTTLAGCFDGGGNSGPP